MLLGDIARICSHTYVELLLGTRSPADVLLVVLSFQCSFLRVHILLMRLNSYEPLPPKGEDAVHHSNLLCLVSSKVVEVFEGPKGDFHVDVESTGSVELVARQGEIGVSQ